MNTGLRLAAALLAAASPLAAASAAPRPQQLAQAASPRPASQPIVLRFRDAPIADVVAAVVGDTLGRAFVIDPRVSGRVTLDEIQPVARAAVLSRLDGALREAGARIADDGRTVRVIPYTAPSAVASAAPARPAPPPPPQFDVVPLRSVEAGALASVMRGMLPPSVTVTPQNGALVVNGPPRERADAIELIRVFDADWLRGQAFTMVKLDGGAPAAVARELEAVLANQGPFKVIPVERANGVLVVASTQAALANAVRAAQALDIGNAVGGRQLYIYPVANGRASELARVLGGLFDADPSATSASQLRPGLDESGIDTGVLLRDDGTGRLDGTDLESRRTSLVNRPARRSEAGAPLAFGTDRVRIVADERNNAISILAAPEDWRMIEAFLQRLDVQPLQVYIEATIAEVTLTDELRYGVQWFFQTGDFDFALSDAPNGTTLPRYPGFSGVFDNLVDARVAIDALDNVTDVKVISSPQVVVLNNQTATLQVGNDVPVTVRSAVGVTDPDSPIVNEVEFRPTGVILRVTPRANANGTVAIDVEQEVSAVTQTTTSNIDSPTIQQRRIETTVSVQSGETIAMGGLIQDRTEKGSRGIPGLSRIPILGALFGTKRDTGSRTELLVLLTPKLIGSREDMRALTDELRTRMRTIAPVEARIR